MGLRGCGGVGKWVWTWHNTDTEESCIAKRFETSVSNNVLLQFADRIFFALEGGRHAKSKVTRTCAYARVAICIPLTKSHHTNSVIHERAHPSTISMDYLSE